MSSQSATIGVFNGKTLFSVALTTRFRDLIAQCREALNDPKLTEDNFGATKYFFLRTEKSLIDDPGFFYEVFTLEKMGIRNGQLLQLCYVP